MGRHKKSKKTFIRRNYLYFFFFFTLIFVIGSAFFLKQQSDNRTGYAQTVSYPRIDRLETVATNVKGDGNTYVPYAWGYHKTRIVRLSTDDVYIPYITSDNKWHLMHRPPSGGWTEVDSGDAGAEPVNIVRGPQDDVHVFGWPGKQGTLNDVYTADNGKTFQTKTIPGFEQGTQGYAGAGANSKGDFVVLNTENDTPYEFWWSYYSAQTKQWSSVHTDTPQYGYSYAFVFPGENNDLIFSAMRDVHWSTLGYQASGDFDYVLNEIRNFTYSDVTNPQMQTFQVKEEIPHGGSPNEMTYEEDAYIDMKGIMHIIYEDANTGGMREALVSNGGVTKDVSIPSSDIYKNRIIQDTTGKFYLITMSNASLIVTPAAAGDTDGTQFGSPVTLSLGNQPGCDDWDFCLNPTLTVPRSGNPVSDVVDGVYSNMGKLYYFRLLLRDTSSNSTPTNTPTPTPVGGGGTSGGGTTLSLTLCPHQIGNCGDNVKQGNGGNMSPKHTSRAVTISVLNESNQPVGTAQGNVSYVSASQNFQGNITLNNVTSGSYLLNVKMDGYLGQKIAGITSITSGQTVTLPNTYLVAGDVNNDNQLDILDYNLLISCFGSKQSSASCTAAPTSTSEGADLNDDGVINGTDYNLFLRELSVQKGN